MTGVGVERIAPPRVLVAFVRDELPAIVYVMREMEASVTAAAERVEERATLCGRLAKQCDRACHAVPAELEPSECR